MISEEQIFSLIQKKLPEFTYTGKLNKLSGGNLNHVWRLVGNPHNVIIKWAPPHIAANPDMPLNPQRIHFEAKALQLFKDSNQLSNIASEKISPPHIFFFDAEKNLLVMEDAGELPAIDSWLLDTGDPEIGTEIGNFIGKLHLNTLNNPSLAEEFNNRDIQQTRQKVQYNPAADYVNKTEATTADSNLLQQKTKTLGQKLLEPGKCLVMGDLWPPSILIDNESIRLIDWEFTHYGRPLQDVAHFGAHCWMQAHAAFSDKHKEAFKKLWIHFWEVYQSTVDSIFPQLFDEEELRDAAIHAGAEILIRAAGPFKEGYVYENYSMEQEVISEAVTKAEELILSGKPIFFNSSY